MNKFTECTFPLKNVRIKDEFWNRYTNLVREVILPYQWNALNDRIPDAPPSYAVRNLRIAAGVEEGEYQGLVFQDSDMAKWLEAASYSLAVQPDETLESQVDEIIDLIGKAQLPDGYMNTYYIVKEPGRRWTNLWECHELYCAGHLIEAAVAHYEATGKRKFLDIMCRFADHIDSVFGPEPGKKRGYPGHEEIELALFKLYRVTGEERYLNLALFFINERGKTPYYFDVEAEERGWVHHWAHKGQRPSQTKEYNQYHLPVREQKKAVGHAVRAVYLYSGMADAALETGDEELGDACRTLWNNITGRQMYITGGIGSTHIGEAFTFDYDLPNDTVYQETCASIGLLLFSRRMLQLEKHGKYADVMERALYNSILSGIALDGNRFFYCNPMEVWPEASEKNPCRRHIKPERQKWYGCACCPPNIARLLSSIGGYIYSRDGNTIYTHLYIGSELEAELDGEKVILAQKTDYPWDGEVTIQVMGITEKEFDLALRMPGWCDQASLKINGEECSIGYRLRDGYIHIERTWTNGDTIVFQMEMKPQLIQAHPQVRANAGRAAIQRGPVVYCLEEVDNGKNLSAISISHDIRLDAYRDAALPGNAVAVRGQGMRINDSLWDENELYRPLQLNVTPVTIKAVPYFMWGNRGIGEMLVWIRCQ
ncbi:MAG TPA: glycoside hydrolase family 127 protein [Clostridiales bacterium]|nr:glycoside hydrolase family 127 protein [Clostridiales bacterium]